MRVSQSTDDSSRRRNHGVAMLAVEPTDCGWAKQFAAGILASRSRRRLYSFRQQANQQSAILSQREKPSTYILEGMAQVPQIFYTASVLTTFSVLFNVFTLIFSYFLFFFFSFPSLIGSTRKRVSTHKFGAVKVRKRAAQNLTS